MSNVLQFYLTILQLLGSYYMTKVLIWFWAYFIIMHFYNITSNDKYKTTGHQKVQIIREAFLQSATSHSF